MIFSQSIHRIPTGYRINIENKKGILSFWRGNLANCLRYVPKFALDMSLKSPIHKMYKDLLIPNPSLIPSSSSTEIYFLHFLTKWLSGASAAMEHGFNMIPCSMIPCYMILNPLISFNNNMLST